VPGGDPRVQAVRLGRFDQGRVGGDVHAPRAGREADARRRARPARERLERLGCEAVVHHGPPGAVDRDPVARHRAVAGEQEDHLEAGKRAHRRTVGRAESRQALRRHEREIHARLEHEAVLRGAVDEIALGVAHIVGDVATRMSAG